MYMPSKIGYLLLYVNVIKCCKCLNLSYNRRCLVSRKSTSFFLDESARKMLSYGRMRVSDKHLCVTGDERRWAFTSLRSSEFFPVLE